MKLPTREWIEKAEGDLKVARREWQAPDPVYDAVCFHAEQCAEKYLKALFEEQDKSAPKTHDLVVLLEGAGASIGELERDPLARLGAYAVTFRYPGENANQEEARDALNIARRVRHIARKALGIANPQ